MSARSSRAARQGAGVAAGLQGPGVLSVTELTRRIKDVLEGGLPGRILLAGEISNLHRPSSGHLYMTLKDEFSQIPAVMWKGQALRLRFRPTDGLAVIATGSVGVYEPYGRYQFYVESLEPKGIGDLELAFRQLYEKLKEQGLFDPARKRGLPRYPRRIAVVTSATGAAVRDIVRTIRRRYPVVQLLVYPVKVQGEGSAAEIAGAIRALNRHAVSLGGIDVMILGRGGGSLEDLWAFNEEAVARAIYASRIPVVSAVGHEIDVTIADLVADVRAATPTAAGELVVPVLGEVLATVGELGLRAQRAVRHRVEAGRAQLAGVLNRHVLRDPLFRLRQLEQRLDEDAADLRSALAGRASRLRAEFADAERSLAAVSPQALLRQGERRVAGLAERLRWGLAENAKRCGARLGEAAGALAAGLSAERLRRHEAEVTHRADRLGGAVGHVAALAKQKLAGTSQRLEAVSYKSVVGRGYSITYLKRGRRLVKSKEQVGAGDRLLTELSDGSRLESEAVDEQQPRLFEG